MKLSLVIPCKDKNDPKLAELLRSIEAQDFPKNEMETLVITEGTSESAKAIGIRKAVGEVIGILASDNGLGDCQILSSSYANAKIFGAAYPAFYTYYRSDNILNRYFALFGGNDPLSFYMGKNDRMRYPKGIYQPIPWEASFGDNGFFIKKSLIEQTDLDNYYHIDNIYDLIKKKLVYPQPLTYLSVWHKTGGNLLSFFKKRYRYGLQHAFNRNRRWHLVDFRQPKDIMRLIWFVICSLTLVEPILLSFRGYLKIRDKAWFLHPVVCIMTTLTYSLLVMHLTVRRLSQSLSAPTGAQTA